VVEKTLTITKPELNNKSSILHDYHICCLSREISLTIRKEVLTGKAKFGVSDDGKEVFQVALAKTFQKGDFRADYYRGHTLLLALEIATPEQILAQLYADANNDPFSGGRQMNGHHASPYIDQNENWLPQKDLYNLSSDISTTAGQMARGLGLAFASKRYRQDPKLANTTFSENGNEVCFCNIGDASTSEGCFWEAVNAAGVTQVPLAITVVDDGYGISVSKKYQTTKESISAVLEGFRESEELEGLAIYHIKGWDYAQLCETYVKGIEKIRKTHTPALFHVDELTQPQGHSTSGSHERYKSKERLQWERDYDCNRQFKLWIIANDIATEEELKEIEAKSRKAVKEAKNRAWAAFNNPLQEQWKSLKATFKQLATEFPQERIQHLTKEFNALLNPVLSEMTSIARRALFILRKEDTDSIQTLRSFVEEAYHQAHNRYHRHLYGEGDKGAINIPMVAPKYSAESVEKNGFEIINTYFDRILAKHDNVYAFGEDVGQIGDVNQGFAGLQEKYGEHRVFDTGIREWTIIGQAIGMAMRGLRPIAEIQYLDYLIYAFPPLSDDLATVRYRTNNIQIAPAIIRTRGHRLEGIWHSGSPMSILLGGLQGMYICTPRNFVQAAGMYNTLLASNDSALVIECLNGYRLKEKQPDNIGEYTVPLGVPDVLQEGTDVTLVTYGSCVRIAQSAIKMLAQDGISVELIDAQTLIPFDLEHRIADSLKKTNRLVILDEDIPGGASAYILKNILEDQGGYFQLDSQPITITAKAHRPPYGSDGDYFTKPNVEDVYEQIFNLIFEAEPKRF
jgi:pyruvate/2-oxoglutarate/acetoin dehydrogenase E1 component/TPP-dependent pyruvate/acetoin dehydrogenase alpha subunit